MKNPDVVRTYLIGEVEDLESLDLILVAPVDKPLEVTEVTRREDGGLEIRLPGRPPVVPQLDASVRQALRDLDFSSEDPAEPTKPWSKRVDDAAQAVDLMQKVHISVFGEKADVRLNIVHGTHRLEYEAEKKLKRARTRIASIAGEIVEGIVEEDDDGDFCLPIGQVHVTVAPRAMPDGQLVIRVFAITNVGIQVSGEIGLFLARLNFGMMLGRFALDVEHKAIWFDETLLGENFREDELRFVIDMVATIADGWDDRLKQMFGGVTYQEVVKGRSREKLPTTKPGEGPGMYL